MLKYIQLTPGDDMYKLDKKLNKQRIEIQGAKPNKMKKDYAPERIEDKTGQEESGGGPIVGVDLNELER